jgi:hypothetical protein
MRGPRPFRLFLLVILALTPLTQSFWFAWAWQVIDAVPWSGPRALLQGLWLVAALVVLAAALDMLRVRIIPRRAFGPWGRAVARLWLIASCFSFLAITVVGSFEGFSRVAIAALPEAQAMRVEPARHTVFRYAAYLVGYPSWRWCMAPRRDGCGIALFPLRCRSRIYPPLSMACASST